METIYCIVYEDGACSQEYRSRANARGVAKTLRQFNYEPRPVGILRVHPKPRQVIANNWGKPRRSKY